MNPTLRAGLRRGRDVAAVPLSTLVVGLPPLERIWAWLGPACLRVGGIDSLYCAVVERVIASHRRAGRSTYRTIRFPHASVRVDVADFTTKWLYFGRRADEPQTTRFILSALSPGDTFVDVGAHHGYYTVLGASAVGDRGRVVAFEPMPSARDALRRVCAENGFEPRVEIVDAAAAGAPGGATLFVYPAHDAFTSLVAPEAIPAPFLGTPAPITVRVDTLDRWRRDSSAPPIRGVKIDVEKAEMGVLDGMRGMLEDGPPDWIVLRDGPGRSGVSPPRRVRVRPQPPRPLGSAIRQLPVRAAGRCAAPSARHGGSSMTRTRKAAVTSAFGYLQFAAAIVLGLVVTPMVLQQVDPRAYGLWLAAGELLGYLALADIGVFAVLPWTIAEAEGRRDREEIRVFMTNGVALGVALAAVTPACIAGVWFLAPSVLGLTAADRALVGPLTILVVASVVSAPLAAFNAALIGLQDVTFVGGAAVARSVLMAAMTVILLARGWGLYALALGAAVPTVLFAFLNVFRVARTEPSLLGGWPRPSARQIRRLVSQGVGGWLGGFGWRLSGMSSSLVLAATGRADLIAIYACTSKTTQLLLQLSWIVPDSALVGLVQIHGEGRPARRREITDALLKLYLVLAGGVAILVLAVNPAFVRWWVGAEFFGGAALNVLLAASLIVSSFAHAVAALGSALGRRLTLGAAGLLQGGAFVLMAIGLVLWLGLEGLVAAAIVSAAITTIPIGLLALSQVADLAPGRVGRDVADWSWRAIPVIAAAALTGAAAPGLVAPAVASLALGMAYLWLTRSLYVELPIGSRYRRLLAAVRLA